MARPRNIIPRIVDFDMLELASKILSMNDAEIVAFVRKAISDCMNGCTAPDCDPFIKEQYEATVYEMRQRQDIQARKYQKKKTLSSGKPDSTISANDAAAVATTPSAGGSCANISAHADVRQSKASGAEDGDTREGSLNCTHTGYPQGFSTAGTLLESTTSSAPSISHDAERVTTPQKTLAVETPDDGLRKAKGAQVSLSCAATASDAEQARSDAAAKRPYGTCGHVMLTDAEGRHLREAYGPDLITAIDILDAYIENNGKAAKRYKNHAAVLRKGNWVWNKILELHRNEKLLENADRRAKSFKEIDRERETKAMHSSIFAPSITTEQTKRIANV